MVPRSVLFWPVSLPPETKLKKYMKAIGKEAAAGCALRHRERRAYVREQVKALAALVGTEPGMLGPKLPMVRETMEAGGGGRRRAERGRGAEREREKRRLGERGGRYCREGHGLGQGTRRKEGRRNAK